MSAALSLNTAANLLVAAPRYRERPRVDLASGAVCGQTVSLSEGVAAGAALDLACRLAALVPLPVSVKVSGPLTALPDLIARYLARSGANPERLEVALGSPALAHAAVECLLALSAVRDLGVGVALHDFGGPATLDLVQYLPLSAVILKPALLVHLPGSANATTVLHTVLGIARQQGLLIVATGIETESQRALLSGLGCHHGEGSLFGTPTLQQDHAGAGHGNTPSPPNLPKH